MSLSYFWRPVNIGMHPLHVATPSAFGETLESVFGDRRPRLGPSELPRLEAMAAVAGDSEPWRELIAAIERHGIIEIDAS